MRKIREVLRLSLGGRLSARAVAVSCGMGRTAVLEYVRRAARAGLSWPLPEGLADDTLEALLFPPAAPAEGDRPLPVWQEVYDSLTGKGVRLYLLWEGYRALHPAGYGYSRFCELYRDWAGKLPVWMRQEHKAGEKLFVDYAGMTMPVTDRETGEVRQAQIFVAALEVSGYTFAEATWTQTLPDFIASHVRALEFFGGCPALVVPDNLRSAVSRPYRYGPEITPVYTELAVHYGVAILPALVRKPRDKAKAESSVLGVERRVLAALRERTFISLAELNAAIAPLLLVYNIRAFQQREDSRRSQFEAFDAPALEPLPRTRHEYAEWLKARVSLDYHIRADGHCYSVPYWLVKGEVQVRMTATHVEIFLNNTRVASHLRSHQKDRHSTCREHMPKGHQAHAEWPPERIKHWVGQAGPATAEVAQAIMDARPHPEQGFRASMGLKRLGDTLGAEPLEAACARAPALQSPSYQSVKPIPAKGLDREPPPQLEPPMPLIEHEAAYYQ
ncbi:MAG: IS21 family transposase [Candidatus Hydrogenedentes bacterium]|nr:IS21 family transposase [Candidatus Hydrogenedentota bacterium]